MWSQLSFDVGAADPESLSDWLTEAGALSVTLLDAADDPLYEPAPGATPLWNRTRIRALFDADADLSAVQRRVCERLVVPELPNLRIEPLEDRDWTRAWMDDYRPMRFGQRLWVCPSGFEPPDPDGVNLLLDPGLAFGTGTHPTTALCLEWLDGAELRGTQVIDYGCGSGILAIAAARLGAAQVWAIDNDPQALTATVANAQANGVQDRIATGLPADLPPLQADVLLANILALPLQALAPTFARLLRPGGRIVLSGVLAEQADEVGAAYRNGFDSMTRVEREGWVRIDAVRNATPA